MAQSEYLMVIERDGSLSTLCHSCGLACQQRVLKRFLAENGYSQTLHFLVNLDILNSSIQRDSHEDSSGMQENANEANFITENRVSRRKKKKTYTEIVESGNSNIARCTNS